MHLAPTHRSPLRYAASWLVAAAVLTLLAGCATPAAKKPISDEDRAALGAVVHRDFVQNTGGIFRLSPALADYVGKVTQRLVDRSDEIAVAPRITITNNNRLYSIGFDGGKIAISRGLLANLSDESELAAGLADAMGEVIHRHRSVQLLYTVDELFAADGDQYLRYAFSAENLNARRKADSVALQILSDGGYPAAAYRKYLQKQRSDYQAIGGLDRLVESIDDRIEQVRSQESEFPASRVRNPNDYRRATRLPRKYARYYADYEKAINKVAKKKSWPEVQRIAKRLIRSVPAEAKFHGLMGRLRYEQEQHEQSIMHLTRAIDRDDGYYGFYFYRGLAQYELENRTPAQEDLRKAVSLYPSLRTKILRATNDSGKN